MGIVYIPETTVDGFAYDSNKGAYYAYCAETGEGIAMKVAGIVTNGFTDTDPVFNETKFPVTVQLDGQAYNTIMNFHNTDIGSIALFIGNAHLRYSRYEDTGEPFFIYGFLNGDFDMDTLHEGASHTFSVSEKSENPGGKINWAKLMDIYHLDGFEAAWIAYKRMKGGGS